MRLDNIFGTTEISKTATKAGFMVGLSFSIIGLIKFSMGMTSIGVIHFLKYFLLFAAVFYYSNQLYNKKSNQLDILSFGFKISIRTAIFNTLFSSIVVIISQNPHIGESLLPIDNIENYLVNIVASLWGCIIFGALVSYWTSLLIRSD